MLPTGLKRSAAWVLVLMALLLGGEVLAQGAIGEIRVSGVQRLHESAPRHFGDDRRGGDGRAGDQIVAEISARRLDSPVDSVLQLIDSAGKQIAFNDDHEDKGTGLNTHHADSYIMTTLPSNGTYYVRLGDTQHNGGPAYSYRLRLSAPRPDFELRVTPSSLNGSSVFSACSSVSTPRIQLMWCPGTDSEVLNLASMRFFHVS